MCIREKKCVVSGYAGYFINLAHAIRERRAVEEHKSKVKNYEIDMCNGPLFSKILLFSLPLMLSGILQLLFNAADIVVVGRYSGNHALAAVGSTSALINLLVNLFIGLSVGVNVMVGKYYGARRDKEIEETVHTAVLTALFAGAILTVIGFFLARPLLQLMGTPADVIDHSVLYMRIYFLGMIGTLVYNFGGAVLRGIGDTRRPLYILLAAGVINVILNLIFVIQFNMGVAGVAAATVISQFLSAALVVYCLMKSEASYHLDIRALRIVPGKLIEMARIGVPAGMQGAVFSISNVLIQSSVNSFGSIAMAGNTAAGNIEGFVWMAMNTFHQAALSFTSQNFGAHKFKRINKVLVICLGLVAVTGLVLGIGAYLAGGTLLQIYSADAQVIEYGILRLSIICTTYFLCGLMDVMSGLMRGLGHSVLAMVVSLVGACGLRIVWIFTVFAAFHRLEVLFLSYPVTWIVTTLVYVVCFLVVRKKQLVE